VATPERLVELQCPRCNSNHWEIDCDVRHENGDGDVSYEERTYRCPACGQIGTGYKVGEKSPPEFFLQPHDMYPMSRAEFDRWVAVLRKNLPDHPRLRDVDIRWFPGESPFSRSR